MDALKALNGIDVVSLNLEGRSDLAEHMVFVTGRSVPHMRKMADTVVKAVRTFVRASAWWRACVLRFAWLTCDQSRARPRVV